MEYKLFMNRIDEHLAAMDSHQLKTWIHNYARTVTEIERNIFLATFQRVKTESHTDEIHKIQIWCDKIDKMEITLTCQGYEDYSSGYWSSDWIYEYEDEQKIGEFLKWIYDLAEKCVYEGDYRDARFIYENVSTMHILCGRSRHGRNS